MVAYIITGFGVEHNKIYLNHETADKACEKVNYGRKLFGKRETAYVKEIEIVED